MHGNRGVRFYRGVESDINSSGTPFYGLKKGAVDNTWKRRRKRNKKNSGTKISSDATASASQPSREVKVDAKRGTTPQEIEETRARIRAAREKKANKGRLKMEDKIRRVNERYKSGQITDDARKAMIAEIRAKHEAAELRNQWRE